MLSEIDFQVAAQHRQATLLNEASTRRMTRTTTDRQHEPQPATARLQTLLRRIAGAPSFA